MKEIENTCAYKARFFFSLIKKFFTQNIKYILRLICDVLRNTALSLFTRELKKYMSLWGSNCFKFAHCLTMSQDELRKYLLARKRLTLLALMVKGKCVKRLYMGFSWRKKKWGPSTLKLSVECRPPRFFLAAKKCVLRVHTIVLK